MSATLENPTIIIDALRARSAIARPSDARPSVELLRADPELGETLDPSVRHEAEASLRARVAWLETGAWHPPESGPPTAYGVLVLEGFIAHRLRVGRGVAFELLGPGSIVRPWDPLPFSIIAPTAEWQVLEPTRLALLDSRVTALMGRWPALAVSVASRLQRRSAGLAYMLAVSNLIKVEDRLLGTLWHLASSWGRMTPDGVKVPLALTHEMLAQIVGAHRPSVTNSLKLLQQRGLVRRTSEFFVLPGEPPDWSD